MPCRFATTAVVSAALLGTLTGAARLAAADPKVSYFKEVRPVFQQHCQGCHQPARAQGGYVMTDVTALLKPGETGKPAVVPGQPGKSELVSLVTPKDGKHEMPKGRDPLSP